MKKQPNNIQDSKHKAQIKTLFSKTYTTGVWSSYPSFHLFTRGERRLTSQKSLPNKPTFPSDINFQEKKTNNVIISQEKL